jgi:hypothetical protein
MGYSTRLSRPARREVARTKAHQAITDATS